MAMIGGYEDSGGREMYPRRRNVSIDGAPSGGTAAPATTPIPEQAPAPAPAPTPAPAPQQYGLSGFDPTKVADPNNQHFKQQFGRIAQGYNPQQGIQSGMLDELNKLGYANFYGQGQHLGYRGVTDAGRGAGLDPHDFQGDYIKDWQGGQNPNATWQYDWWTDPTQQAAGQTPDLSGLFAQLFQQPQQTPPSINITNSGIDPKALEALMATYAGGQTQQVSAPGYQPSAPQTQAPTPSFSGTPSQGGSVQTQSAGQTVQPGMDPFMAWLRSQVFGGQQ